MTRQGSDLFTMSEIHSHELLDAIESAGAVESAPGRAAVARANRAAVTVRPADVAARDQMIAVAQVTELRARIVVCIAPRPVMVGSFFQLAFERAELDVAPTLGQCERCHMLGDTAFELRFKLVQEIELPATQLPRATT